MYWDIGSIAPRAAIWLLAWTILSPAAWADSPPEIPRPAPEPAPGSRWLQQLPPVEIPLPKLSPLPHRARHTMTPPDRTQDADAGTLQPASAPSPAPVQPTQAEGSAPISGPTLGSRPETEPTLEHERPAVASPLVETKQVDEGSISSRPPAPTRHLERVSEEPPVAVGGPSKPEPPHPQAPKMHEKHEEPPQRIVQEPRPITRLPERMPETEGPRENPFLTLPGAAAPPARSEAPTPSGDRLPRRTAGSSYRWEAQVLAGRSLARVKEDRHLIIERYSNMLDGLSLAISQSDYGDARDEFYRLRVVDWDDPAKANRWCEQLRARGQACLVVRVPAGRP